MAASLEQLRAIAERGAEKLEYREVQCDACHGQPHRQIRDMSVPGGRQAGLCNRCDGLGVMWLTLIVAETISASSGIGYMTMNAREFLQTDVVVVGILLYALLGKLADMLAKSIERATLRWHPAYQKGAKP